MQLLKRLLVGLIVLLMLAVYLTPLNVYVPEVERTLSVRLHVPVRIGCDGADFRKLQITCGGRLHPDTCRVAFEAV